MLVEMRLVEQRYQTVLEVLNDGASVVDVARRYSVARQTVHDWLRKYAAKGLAGLVDQSSKPLSCRRPSARFHTVLRLALGQVVRWRWLAENPALHAKLRACPDRARSFRLRKMRGG